jgi:hypothetical protein
MLATFSGQKFYWIALVLFGLSLVAPAAFLIMASATSTLAVVFVERCAPGT